MKGRMFILLSLIVAITLLVPGGVRHSEAQSQGPIAPTADNPNPPTSPVKLVFIHHSVGDSWLDTGMGDLGNQLGANNYYVSDTYYDWGPDDIGSYTDIGNWWDWFRGPNSTTYTQAVYNTTNRHADYTRPMADPSGENEIIMFKSCYPNSHLGGNPDDPPPTGLNPLRGEDCTSEQHTVGNAKGIYNDILEYFRTRQDKLFVVITAPSLVGNDTDSTHAANARAFNNWLVNDWLSGYPYNNVAVFDFYNVLSSNGGDANTNDLGWETGNHHRWWNGAVQHIQTVVNNFAAYGSDPWDSHPTAAGNQKATAEFVHLLNVFYHRWYEWQEQPPFIDVGPGDWFFEAVMNLYNRGIVSGYPDGTFGPSNQVTRAEFATMLVRAMGWAIDTSGPDFPDVPPTHWAYGFVKTARNQGMVSGYPDGTFRPDNPISRAEIATMIVRAMGWAIDTSGPDFPDVPLTHWAYGFIKTARNHVVVSGYPDGTFMPDNPSTRAEAAAMIYRALP